MKKFNLKSIFTNILSDNEIEAKYSEGYYYFQNTHYTKAIEIFRYLVIQNPHEKRFWKALAASYQEEKEYNLASRCWAMVAIIDSKDPYPHFHAAKCLFFLDQLEEAIKALLDAKKRIEGDDHPLIEKISLLLKTWKDKCQPE